MSIVHANGYLVYSINTESESEVRLQLDALLKRAQNGDQAAEEELFRQLRERFQLFLQHKVRDQADAEDLLQSTLMTIKLKCQDLAVEKSFAAWAHGVLLNNIKRYYRNRKTHDSRQVSQDPAESAIPPSSTYVALEQRLLHCLRLVGSANQRYARVLSLHYQGYETEEICEKLGLTRGNLYLILFRARAMLKICLEKGAVES